MNGMIRNSIVQYIQANGPTDSRKLISYMAKQYAVPKQKISGNLSFMICKAGTININRNKPHSFVY